MQYRLSFIMVLTIAISLLAIGAFAAELTEGIVGYWPLDGNSNDESGNGYDAKLEKGAKYVDNGWVD